jgi:D-alanyl-D-alanine carboxypeptidase/D-alanyl-D-alanine-endopeptidase (penicillin-binding protein 4)
VVKRATKRVTQGENELRLDRDKEDPYTFKLSGTLRFPPDGPVQVTVHESCLMLGRLLGDRIVKAGLSAPGITAASMPVRMAGPDERLAETPGAGAAPAGVKLLTVVRTPIAVVLERCNVDSDNLYAESLLKYAGHHATGQPGSWSNGAAVVRMQVKERLGPAFAGALTLSDGSGLSRANRVTPRLLTRWLANLGSDPEIGEMFVHSLAEIGEGTLRKRFKGAKIACEVRGKSGYIRQVRTLSGYVTAPISEGERPRRLAYSILVDQIPPGADAKAKEFHEDVVEILDRQLGSEPKTVTQPPSERIGG